MIRILHTADLHLGVENYGRMDPTTGLSTRLGDFLLALDDTVDYAMENGVHLLLFCGDAYKTREPTPTHQREVAKRIQRLSSQGIAVFLLIGNHDLPLGWGRATTLEIFHTLSIPNVHVVNRPGVYPIETPGGTVQVVALPWVTRSLLLAREEYKDKPVAEINRLLEERLTRLIQAQTQDLNPRFPTVLAGHVLLSEATLGSEKGMTMGKEPVLLKSNVANPAFHYVALGHIHKHQVLHVSPPVVYAGSLQRIDFGEEAEEKGFCVVDIEESLTGEPYFSASFRFVPVRARSFLTIEVEADGEDPTAQVLEAIARREIKEAVVRLNISIPAPKEGLLREGDLRKALQEAHYLIINKNVKREQRIRLGGKSTEELTPQEALGYYLKSKNTPPARAKVLLEYAEHLLGDVRS